MNAAPLALNTNVKRHSRLAQGAAAWAAAESECDGWETVTPCFIVAQSHDQETNRRRWARAG